MDGALGMEAVDESDIIGSFPQVGKNIGNHFAALATGLELPLGPNRPATRPMTATPEGLHRNGLAIERIKSGLIVESVHVTGTAIHEQKNHRLGLGLAHRFFGCQRVAQRGAIRRPGGLGKELVTQQAAEGDGRKSSPGVPEKIAAGAPAELTAFVHGYSLQRPNRPASVVCESVEVNEFVGCQVRQAQLAQSLPGGQATADQLSEVGDIGIHFGWHGLTLRGKP